MWAKGIMIGLSLAVVASVGAVLSSSRSSGQENQARLISRRLLHVTPGVHRGVIHLHIGDMLQIEPFELPVTPKFLSATLRLRTVGARSLELIGQSGSTNSHEGRTGRSAFFRALGLGRSTIHVVLADGNTREIENHEATYEVNVIGSN